MSERDVSRMCVRKSVLSIVVLCLVLGAGCVSDPLMLKEQTNGDLLAAESAFASGQYYLARMRYAMVLEQYPHNETALYGLGLSHYRLGADANAEAQLRRYMQEFPNGRYAQDALHYLAEIEARQEARHTEKAKVLAEAQERVVRARDAVEQSPNNGLLRIELGDAYWDIGQYDQAAEQYVKAVKLDGKLRRHPDVRNRIEFGRGNKVTVLTPEEREKRDRETHPIVVENTRGYRTGLSPFNYGNNQDNWYIVSGQVRNQSTHRVNGVLVETTIFDLSGHVLDARQIYIGSVPQGSVRSFSARLTHFDDINNVYRYECKVFTK